MSRSRRQPRLRGDDFEDPFQNARRPGCAVMSLTRFLSALKTLIPLTDGCFVQSMLPQL